MPEPTTRIARFQATPDFVAETFGLPHGTYVIGASMDHGWIEFTVAADERADTGIPVVKEGHPIPLMQIEGVRIESRFVDA